MFLLACAIPDPEPVCVPSERLFGAPSEATGLDTGAWAPTCDRCGDAPHNQTDGTLNRCL